MAGLTSRLTVADVPDAVADFEDFLALGSEVIDGKHASMEREAHVLMPPAALKIAGSLYNMGDGMAASQSMTARFASARASALMPAVPDERRAFEGGRSLGARRHGCIARRFDCGSLGLGRIDQGSVQRGQLRRRQFDGDSTVGLLRRFQERGLQSRRVEVGLMLETTFAWTGDLEIRQPGRGRSLTGSFPYGRLAVRSDRGRVRKERIGPRAFRFAVEDPEREINLLAGHSFDRPIASKRAGTLKLRDSDEALLFEVPVLPDTPVARQLIEEIEGRSFVPGISPGFQGAAVVCRAECGAAGAGAGQPIRANPRG